MENNWVGRRIFKSRWGTALSGIVNFAIIIVVFFALWRIIMDPTGVMRLYTPMYGFSYFQVLMIMILLTALIMNFSPVKTKFLKDKHPVVKGISLIVLNLVGIFIAVNVIFYGFMGNVGIPYFSPDKLTELGMSSFLAREYASAAIIYVCALAGLIIPIWFFYFKNWPANEIKNGKGAVTSVIVILFLTLLGFFVLLQPHFGILFYPWQKYVAAFPWWEKIAGTLSGNFNLGWIMCWTVAVWTIETLWEGYPFKLIKKQPYRTIVSVVGSFVIGMILFKTFVLMENVVWGTAVRGAKLMLAPDWRYLHAGESAMFLLVMVIAWNTYFKNLPNKFEFEINLLVRTGIVTVLSIIFYVLFYKFNHLVLGTQAGYAHPSQFPLAPMVVIICLMLIHDFYFDRWPGEKVEKVLEENESLNEFVENQQVIEQ